MRRDGDNQHPVINSDLLNDTITNNITRLCEYFFPLGIQKGTDWTIGDTSGAKGQSLRISLLPKKAGQWHDFSNSDKGTFANLIQKSKNLSFPQAADAIGSAVGINLRLAAISEKKASIPFDWHGVDFAKLTNAQKLQFSEWRGLSRGFVDQLDELDLLRIYKGSNWAFQIKANGKIIGAHCRPIINPNGSRVDWEIIPAGGGFGLPPLVLQIESELKPNQIHLFESQFDLFAACDKLGFHEAPGTAAICNRGASNFKYMPQLPPEAKLYLWVQNDEPDGKGKIAGEEWIKGISRSVKREVYRVVIPKEYKDLNDWVVGGVSDLELNKAIQGATIFQVASGENPQPENKQEKELLELPSWVDYGDREIDRSQYHIGEGFSEIASLLMLIGQSYIGKSTFMAQLIMNMAIGRDWLFFQMHKPLSILLVQGEDTSNKLIKMGRMYKRLGITKGQIEQIQKNTKILTLRNLQGLEAIDLIKKYSDKYHPDVLCINPLTSYISGSVYKDEDNNKFIRQWLIPTLDKYRMSGMLAHHPPKPPLSKTTIQDQLTEFELQYGAAGMASLTNACRSNMFLTHVNDEVYKISVAKGFSDLGTDKTWSTLKRSVEGGIMLWEECNEEEFKEAEIKLEQRKSTRNNTKPLIESVKVWEAMSPIEEYNKETFIEWFRKTWNQGEKRGRDILSALVHEGLVQTITLPRSGTRPEIIYKKVCNPSKDS